MQDDRIKSVTELAHVASELQDSDVTQIAKIMNSLSRKFSTQTATVGNLDALRDEATTRLADIGILASVDVAPVLSGEPPTVEILGRVSGHSQHTYGMDHERKMYEVRKATARGEEYLGQKERPDARRAKK